ncbi:MAG: hypothetical protein FWG18_03600, partial [Alphaproteobacteria bacterium]|nr:hypothetical protein [Alphaproteobacteria bacterium]
KKVDADVSVMPTDELIHSTREFAPEMPAGAEEFMRESATKLFDAMGASGAPRIDFYSDSESGEIWMNEVNPVPGAFAFHLWRVARVALSYQEIVSTLIDNAFARASETNKTFNLNTAGSVIFKK